MIYILYESKKTNIKEVMKHCLMANKILQADLELQYSKLRKEEQCSITALFLALYDEILQGRILQEKEGQLRIHQRDLQDKKIQYASAYELNQEDVCRYIICFHNDTMPSNEGVQFILYHSEEDDALICKEREGMLQIYLNLSLLEEDNMLTRFAQGFDDLMVKKPSLQLLKDVCDMHPLFANTFPFFLMFLCNANHMSVQVHTLKQQTLFH